MPELFGEPWRVEPSGLESDGLLWERWDIYDAAERCPASVEGVKDEPPEPEEAFGIAKRIVAAVNALSGVADPAAQVARWRELEAAAGELETLRGTNTRLNRRCQSAERGLKAKLTSGFSFGRALANSAAVMWHEKCLEIAAQVAELEAAAREDHSECEAKRRAGLAAHPCRVCDALAALAARKEATS